MTNLHHQDFKRDDLVQESVECEGNSLLCTFKMADKLELASKMRLWHKTAHVAQQLSQFPLTQQILETDRDCSLYFWITARSSSQNPSLETKRQLRRDDAIFLGKDIFAQKFSFTHKCLHPKILRRPDQLPLILQGC